MNHLTNDLLVRHLDDELSPSELLLVESHLLACEECRMNFGTLRKTAGGVDDFFLSLQPDFMESERAVLAKALALQQSQARLEPSTAGGKSWFAIGRHQWAAALAASVAAGVLYLGVNLWQAGHRGSEPVLGDRAAGQTSALTSFDIDGETFWALPYSNPDLPVSAPRVVQMEVPVASLADAGIMVEPVANRAAAPDRSVLADVLLGLDGQPVGVHVLSTD